MPKYRVMRPEQFITVEADDEESALRNGAEQFGVSDPDDLIAWEESEREDPQWPGNIKPASQPLEINRIKANA